MSFESHDHAALYGYHGRIEELRRQFSRLKDTVYLDHAGATLYSDQQLDSATAELRTTLLGNPHSGSRSSAQAAQAVAEARQNVADFFHAPSSDYSVVFTSGATAALKLVGEMLPWTRESKFTYLLPSHTSVVGIREYVVEHEGQFDVLSEDEAALLFGTDSAGDCTTVPSSDEARTVSLFAYPLECNFSGRKFPRHWARSAWQHLPKSNTTGSAGRWLTLVDAAKAAASTPIDVAELDADFVVVSFYKMFGWPDGLGALIVRNDVAKLLRKRYFGGGTVSAVVADAPHHKLRASHAARLEDGTLPFLSIAALKYGFEILRSLTMPAIAKHTFAIASYIRSQLASMRHSDTATPVAVIYGWNEQSSVISQGGTVACNFLRSDGSMVGYAEVDRLAALNNLHIRTGCFCNPGACQRYLGLSADMVLANYEAGHTCWDTMDVINGVPTGAVRVSFGYMSTVDDADAWLQFVRRYFVAQSTVSSVVATSVEKGEKVGSEQMILQDLVVFPIKSCSGVHVSSWPINASGLLLDREWSVVDPTGAVLGQKQEPRMCLIQPSLDLDADLLTIRAPGMEHSLELKLSELPTAVASARVRGSKRAALQYDERVCAWFSEFLGRPCLLMRQNPATLPPYQLDCALPSVYAPGQQKCGSGATNFANIGQFLLVSSASVDYLNQQLPADVAPVPATRFRGNFIVSGAFAHAEDSLRRVRIGTQVFDVTQPCSRCSMVCIDQATALVHPAQPLLTLAGYRRDKGMILFGQLLTHDAVASQAPFVVQAGAHITPL